MTIDESLERLKSVQEEHYKLSTTMLQAYGNAFYSLDLLIMGAVQRSLHLIPAFIYCVESKNFFAVAPLLRMQVDNALRVSAAWLVKNPHGFAQEVMSGIPVRKFKDTKGKKLTDAYLVEQLSKEYPWVASVYDRCSDYVHLSDAHVWSIFRKDEQAAPGEAKFGLAVGFGTVELPDDKYVEAIEAFVAATDILFHYMKGYTFTKDNPEAVKKLRLSMTAGVP